ncbi:MAG: serine/threonine protein kinase [Planctomycetes bacterium]|nr:serine/threonine protein kinase [Planctomycetota bacterium]
MSSETKSSKAPQLQTIGSYDVVATIAEGGMGTVYKGRHQVSGAIVAVKVLPPHLVANPDFLKRFEREYNAAKTLDHANIVKAIEFGSQGDTPYLVMEFVEGESVGQKLERAGRLPESEAVRIIVQVAQGLHKAHKLGLIHRDVKPDNILLSPDGVAKLVDLGLVKETDADLNLTRTNRGLGTPHFMAPEQFRNAKNADARCDIYSMAASLYMMVTGELPFKSCGPLDAWMKKINHDIPPPRQLQPSLSERVDWAIRRSMSADPTTRAANCREFVEDLTGHSTRRITVSNTASIPASDLWYLVYKDEDGVVHTVKGAMNGIRRSLKEGLLGDAMNIRISRMKDGPFESLRNHPEFRDLAVAPQEAPQAISPTKHSTPNPVPLPVFAAPDSVSHHASPAVPVPLLPPGPAPHIDIGTARASSEWLKWLLLIVVAIVTGVAGLLFRPVMTILGWW